MIKSHFVRNFLIRFILLAAFCLLEPARLPLSSVNSDSTTTQDHFKVTTVFVVRHAERATRPPEDPVLTDEGRARAEKLSHALQSAGIKAIYVSQFQRTKLTAEPIARRLNLSVNEITVRMDQANPRMVSQDSIRAVVDKIYEQAGGAVLVVGHSNTLPEVIKMLGGDIIPSLGERDYDDIFIVTVYEKGKSKVIRVKYGEPSQS